MIERVEAIKKVIEERIRQNQKWGYPQQNTPFEWVSILTEEVGEFAEATNDALLGSYPNGDLGKAIEEVIQVAAVAISIIEHLSEPEKEGFVDWPVLGNDGKITSLKFDLLHIPEEEKLDAENRN